MPVRSNQASFCGEKRVAGTFVAHLKTVVAAHATDRRVTFVGDAGERISLSYADVDAGASRRARLIAAHSPAGAHVLLLYPEGLEFLQTFLGCLYGGRVAVPAP